MKRTHITLLIVILSASLQVVRAQNDSRHLRGIGAAGQAARLEARTALVIGNGQYIKPGLSLNNPVNDAEDMTNKLKDLRFNVTTAVNLSKSDLERQFDELSISLRNSRVFLFYYAGHGVQVDGENYLIPVDASIVKADDIKEKAVNLRLLLKHLQGAGNRLNIIILDACRNNPFLINDAPSRDLIGSNVLKREKPGLARIDITGLTNTLIAYSTQTDSFASDGSGRNGLFTSVLLSEIGQEGRNLIEVFQNVRRVVENRSNRQQIPWELSSLTEAFYLAGPAENQSPPVLDLPSTESDGQWYVTALRNLELRSNQPLADTGLVVSPGMSLNIRVSSGGKIQLGNNIYSGPGGVSETDKLKPVQDCPTGAIIASVGDSYFCVKSQFDRILSSAGPLRLGINESNYADNIGTFSVKIQIQQFSRD